MDQIFGGRKGKSLFSLMAFLFCLVIGGLSNKNVAHAQMTAHEDEEDSREKESVALPEIVVTATRAERDPLYVPRGINVVTRERIGERSPLSVVDTLDDTIGVWVEKRTTTTSDPVIRGLSGSNLLALIDMNTLSTFWGEGGFAGDDMYGKIDADSIERVEVIRGPASVLYGSNALGGVLNFITKSCPIPYTAQGLRLGSFSKVTYGSAANEWHLRQEGYSSTPFMKTLLGISYRDVDDVRTPDGIQSPTSGEDLNWDAKFEFKLAENHFLTMTTQMINRDKIHRYYRPTQDNFNDRLGAGLFYDAYSLGCPVADAVHARAYFQDKEDVRIWFDAGHEEITKVGLANTETFQTSIQAEKALGKHSITYGVDYHVDWGESPDDEQFTELTMDDGLKRKASPNTDWQGIGTFIQDEWSLFDRLDLIGAVRFDYFIFRSHVGRFYVPAGGDDPEIDEFTDHEQAVTGGFGLVFHLMERCNLFANYQRGFRQFAPNFGVREHAWGILTPNQLLEPVTSDNWEAGIKVDRKGWGGEALYYYSDLNNFQNIVPGTFQGSDWYDYNGNEERDDGEDVYVTVGNGDAFVYGVEASSWLELTTLWEAIPRGLTLHAGFMWNYGRDRTNDIPLRHTHPMRGILKLRYDEPTERRWWFEVMADMVDRFDKIPPDRLAHDVGYLEEPQAPLSGMRRAYGLPGYTVYHLRAGYRFTDHVQASLSVDNLTDKLYRRAHSRWDEPGTNALVSLEMKF